jgi:hypothetical protein
VRRSFRSVTALPRLAEAPVNRSIRSERWTQRNIEQAALPSRIDARNSHDWLADLTGGSDNPQVPGFLRDQQVAIGQRLDRPRFL